MVQTTQLNYIGEVKWSSPISNRVLAEASIFTLPVNYTLGFEPDAAPDAIATFDQIRSTIREDWQRYGRAWCPHTATAAWVYRDLARTRAGEPHRMVSLDSAASRFTRCW